ncbi:MAG: MFS transporter [Fimbriimonadia bacterium]|nr:MFS transporter [Fimbriimonadia bacterium]
MTETSKPLSRLEIMRGLKWADRDAIFVTVYLALTGGAFQTGFARHLGANDLWLGIMAAVPAIAGGLQILAAYAGEQTNNRKKLVIQSALLSRLPWLLIAFLPLLSPNMPRLPVFILLLTLSAILGSFAGPAFLAWLSDLVPADHRGRYFGRRNMLLGLVAAATALPPAIFLDQAVKYQRFPVPVAFAALFGLGFVFLVLSLFALTRMPDAPRERSERAEGWQGFLQFYREPFQNKNFRRLLTFTTFWTFGQLFAGQFFTVYMLEIMEFPYLLIQMTAFVASLFSSLAMPFWGYLSDKFGNRPLLTIAGTCVVFIPFLWMLTSPDRYHLSIAIIMFIQVLAGFLWAGVGLSQFNMSLSIAPPAQRTVYMGAIAAIGALIGGLAPLTSGFFMEMMKPHVPDPTRFFVLFGTAAALRGFAMLWLRGVHDPQAAGTSYVLSQLRSSARPQGWMAMRRLKRGTDEASRLNAVRTLAQTRAPLAVEDLSRALHDPSPEVRRQAAAALGEIGDPRAVPVLIEAMEDPASDLRLETIEALGKIGSSDSIAPLIRQLGHARSDIRLSAIHALRLIADPASLPALRDRLGETDNPAEQARLLEAITEILPSVSETLVADLHATEQILMDCLSSSDAEVRSDAAEGIARLPINHTLAPILRLKWEEEADEAALAAVSKALARHGEAQDTAVLLRRLSLCKSPRARQQIALSVAQLGGWADRLYPLLTADELTRDRMIERILQARIRQQPASSEILSAYAASRYEQALQTLTDTLPDQPFLEALRASPAGLETWLLAIASLDKP